ncbi:META domain-containing protein [Streptomyces sp. NPDC054961]
MRTLPLLPAALVAVLALSATATACGDEGAARGTRPDRGFTGTWSVVSLTEGGRTLTAPDAAGLTLRPGKGGHEAEVTGNYGCNGFTARVVFDSGTTMTVRPGSSTDMACENMRFETAFARLFQGRLTVREQPDAVTLKTPEGNEISLTTKPRTPAAPLLATVWIVDSLLDGDTASSLPAEAAGKARFTVAADGSASGGLGCNRFDAKATVEGGSLTFGPLATTRMACTGPQGQVEQALTALFAAGRLGWHIQDDTLHLTTADATKGLTAKASSAAE